ncbi:hypothetical protein MPER_11746, partial [Moniliophthora perniciosa FA553]
MFFNTLLAILAITGTATCSCLHGTTHMRREITEQGHVKVSDFSYSGARGPIKKEWISPDNAACRTGTNAISRHYRRFHIQGCLMIARPIVENTACQRGKFLKILGPPWR